MDAAVAMAKNIIKTGYSDLPSEAVEATKKDILDTLGAILAGSAAPGGREIAELMKELGGRPESTVLVYGGKISSVSAAMANGAMGHALDYDDTHDQGIIHAGVTVVPAAFATAERVGKVNGKDFIAAVALGVDVACRMALANNEGPAGWILTPLYGFFGAAAAAAKVMGLDEAKTVSALGIAYAQASGNNQSVDDGALTKRMQAGFAARGGVMAALMAQKGITGAINSLEGGRGIYKLYHGGDYNPAPLTDQLGAKFEVADLSFKPYPCCRTLHPYIDAALALAKEHNLRAEDVEEIAIGINKENHPRAYPLEVKCNPRTVVDAQFSIPYAVACALAKRQVVISDFTEAGIQDKTVLTLANKVRPRFEPKMIRRELTPGLVEVKTRSGSFSKYIDIAYGHPKNPMSMGDIVAKFEDCARNAARPIPKDHVTRAIEMVAHLEKQEDVGGIVGLLA
ncbi:MAG: MmgE/PrpD family protein [Chloroflexi bacterium]|nr:MmgE/PrpD family protein [Chloroflexota bacterium]